MTAGGLEDLCREASEVTGVRLALEGVYRWLAFLPLPAEPGAPGGHPVFRGL